MNAMFALNDLNPEFDDEPRIRDILIGERLGYERPRDVRKVIERNLEEIESHGLARQTVAPIVSGKGREMEVEEYWLNEAQALLVCMFARTEAAAEVRKALIDVFMAWRRGQLDADAVPPVDPETANLFRLMDPEEERLWHSRINLYRKVWGREAARWAFVHSPLPSPPREALRSGSSSGAGMSAVIDRVADFLRECTRALPGGYVAKGELYQCFVAWCAGEGCPTLSVFGKAMAALGVTTVRARDADGNRYWAYQDIAVGALVLATGRDA